jgi:Tfp pilus assembly protein PilF
MGISINYSLSKNLFQACVVILSIACVSLAQSVGSSRGLSTGEGTNTIQGRVYFPAGEQNKGKSVKLHLESDNQTAGQSAVTDVDGVFRFNSLVPGNYTVVVDGGKEYESTRESVSLDRSGGRTTQVNIQLRPKIDAANPAFADVPKPALEFYQKGMAAAQKGDSNAAIQFLTQAVTAAPTFALALNELGTQYEKKFQWSKASEIFESLVKLKPTDASAHLSLGIALYNEGSELMGQKKFDEAEKKFNSLETHMRESIKLKSPSPTAHYYLGLMLIKFKTYDEAQKELEAAIKDSNDSLALAHKFLGGVYISTNKPKEAADELEKYLKLDPKASDAERIKGTINELRNKKP